MYSSCTDTVEHWDTFACYILRDSSMYSQLHRNAACYMWSWITRGDCELSISTIRGGNGTVNIVITVWLCC